MLAVVRTQVQLTEEQAARLHRAAAERGVSMAALIREAVDELPATRGEDARWDRALSAVGCGASGRGDVSSDHDRYLAWAFKGDVR
jgi:Arc/MetJ-type ribon-helix-helix transcriptional regulator